MKNFALALACILLTSAVWWWGTQPPQEPEVPEDAPAAPTPDAEAPNSALEQQLAAAQIQIAMLESQLESQAETPATPRTPSAPTTPTPAVVQEATAARTPGEAVAEVDGALAGALGRDDEFWGRLADLCIAHGHVSAAKLYLLRALRLDPEDWEWLDLLEQLSLEARKEVLEQLVVEFPDQDEFHGDLGEIHLELNDIPSAVRAFVKAQELDPEDREWSERLAELDPDMATTLLRVLLHDHPEDDELHGDLADALRRAERTEEAAQSYTRALILDPDDSEWARRLAGVDPAQAVTVLERIAPLHTHQWGHLGHAYAQLGRTEEAVAALTQAVQHDPEGAAAWWSELSEVDPSAPAIQARVAHARGLVAAHPEDGSAQRVLGEALTLSREFPEARAALERALELDPEDEAARERIAELERLLRQDEE